MLKALLAALFMTLAVVPTPLLRATASAQAATAETPMRQLDAAQQTQIKQYAEAIGNIVWAYSHNRTAGETEAQKAIADILAAGQGLNFRATVRFGGGGFYCSNPVWIVALPVRAEELKYSPQQGLLILVHDSLGGAAWRPVGDMLISALNAARAGGETSDFCWFPVID